MTLGAGTSLGVASERALAAGEVVNVVVRAEKVAIAASHPGDPGVTILDGTVADVDYLGVTARYFVEAVGQRIQVISTIESHPFREGDAVQLRVRPQDCVLLDETGKVHS